MILRTLTIILMLLFASPKILSAAEKTSPPANLSHADAIAIKVTGALQSGVMAIGGETSGTTITSKNIPFDIDWGDHHDLARRAKGLDGQRVSIEGSLRQQVGPERGRRLIIEVRAMRPLATNIQRPVECSND